MPYLLMLTIFNLSPLAEINLPSWLLEDIMLWA